MIEIKIALIFATMVNLYPWQQTMICLILLVKVLSKFLSASFFVSDKILSASKAYLSVTTVISVASHILVESSVSFCDLFPEPRFQTETYLKVVLFGLRSHEIIPLYVVVGLDTYLLNNVSSCAKKQLCTLSDVLRQKSLRLCFPVTISHRTLQDVTCLCLKMNMLQQGDACAFCNYLFLGIVSISK